MRARARASNAGVKTRTERRGAPPFQTLVEARACLPRPSQQLPGPAPGRRFHKYLVHVAAMEMTVSNVKAEPVVRNMVFARLAPA
jgi:hypothetical protein